MGLIDAYYQVFHLMSPFLEHLELLEVYRLNDPILPLEFVSKREVPKTVKLLFDRLEVPSEVLELRLDPFPDCILLGVLVLRHL